MGKMHSVSVLITFGAITGNSILTVYASAARDLTTTRSRSTTASAAAVYKAALADQFGDVVAVAATGLTLTAATFANKSDRHRVRRGHDHGRQAVADARTSTRRRP
jgi:hypothetical protein